ncbi:MAG TPA: cysteine desulfurase family protein [Acidobacteriota bacterium]|nr:cysteine desulfurase family protein [Acidobacteriota bacterium]
MERIYLDYNASTPLDPRVVDAMSAAFNIYGNPSSIHQEGRHARALVDHARVSLATLVYCDHRRLVFTSSGTEANNLAILGTARANKIRGNHLITSAIEHSSVLNTFRQLEKEGFEVTYLAPTSDGIIDPELLASSLRNDSILVSIMMANNEIGTIQPIEDLVSTAHQNGTLFHTDAIQALGKIPVNIDQLKADLVSFSSHKIYGPKGAGVLYCSAQVDVEPLMRGGTHEQSLRPGTENVLSIHGFGSAADLLAKEGLPDLFPLRKQLENGLHNEAIQIICEKAPRLPNTVNFYFPEWTGESLVMALDLEGFAVSNGSACSAGIVEPSHVILALGYNEEVARSVIRISFGKFTQANEIDRFLEFVHRLAQRVGKTMP